MVQPVSSNLRRAVIRPQDLIAGKVKNLKTVKKLNHVQQMERFPNIKEKVAAIQKNKPNFLDKIWGKVRTVDKGNKPISSIMHMAHDSLNASASSLLLIDEASQEFLFRFASDFGSNKVRRLYVIRKSSIAGWIVGNKTPVIVNNTGKNRNFYRVIDEATGFKTCSIIGVPLLVNDKVISIIEILNKVDGSDFNRHDLSILLCVLPTAGIAIEYASQNKSLEDSYKNTVNELVPLADAKEIY